MLEFQDISGTREHLKQKYLRRRWYRSPVVPISPVTSIAPSGKPKFKIQPRFISDPTQPVRSSLADPPKKALDSTSDANDDVMFVKPQARRKADYPVEKFDSFGFSDKFSRMYIQHTTSQAVTDRPLQAVSYSFDAFVPKIDAKLREERQRAKAAAIEAQQLPAFPVAQPSSLPLTPQHSPEFPPSPNYYSESHHQDLFGAAPFGSHPPRKDADMSYNAYNQSPVHFTGTTR